MRREHLLSTALALFVEHGYAATSTKKIADAAGVTEGLVFHYFGTKDALLLALMSKQNSFAGKVLTLVQQASEGNARDLFRAVAAGYSEVSAEEMALVGFFSAEAQVNRSLRTTIAAGTQMMVDGFVALLRARVETGELRRDASLEATTLGFFGGFSFFFAQHRDRSDWRVEAGTFAAAWAEQCWRGLATREALEAADAPSLSKSSMKHRSTQGPAKKRTTRKDEA